VDNWKPILSIPHVFNRSLFNNRHRYQASSSAKQLLQPVNSDMKITESSMIKGLTLSSRLRETQASGQCTIGVPYFSSAPKRGAMRSLTSEEINMTG
jgi:hypothetical protein